MKNDYFICTEVLLQNSLRASRTYPLLLYMREVYVPGVTSTDYRIGNTDWRIKQNMED